LPEPHTVFSLCPQPITTEKAPKNVVDVVSDIRLAGHSLGMSEEVRKSRVGFEGK
jgi:hypothetical protein